MKRQLSLWQWVGWRMGLTAVGAVVVMTFIMWLRYFWWNFEIHSKIPPADRDQLNKLVESPAGHEAQLWAYFSKYYHLDDILPGLTGEDWWVIALLVTAALPVMVAVGFLLLRPLSRRFIEIAQAARKVAKGNLNVRLPITEKMPVEIQRLASDFNSMTQRLQMYEQEVQESSAVLAHELRTPLNAAMGRVRGMLDEVFPANPEQISLVLHQLENINVLVNDLLLLSLAQAGRLPLTKTTFHIDALLNERISWFNPQFMETSKQVRLSASSLPPVIADRHRIGQVLNVLFENYFRYASAGGDLEIRCVAVDENITLTFVDQGPGLTEDEIGRVFERFWRKETSRDRRVGGSGLGLSIALAICSAHGGSLAARNRTHGGMEFKMKLPCN